MSYVFGYKYNNNAVKFLHNLFKRIGGENMKKGNRKLLAVAVLLLFVTISFGTYAIYRVTSTGAATVDTAAWTVKLNGTSQTSTTKTFTFTNSDIDWTNSKAAVANKIAPGATGTITVELDATGSEVNVAYDVNVKSIKVDGEVVPNANEFSVALNSSDTGKLAYAAENMKKNIVLDFNWAGSDSDNDAKDAADIAINNKSIEVEVEITVKQDLGA